MKHNNYIFDESGLPYKPEFIKIAKPPIGDKIDCKMERGLFVFEEGPTLWRAFMCTHAGSGGIVVYDGVPNEDGFFPEEHKVLAVVFENPTPEQVEEAKEQYIKECNKDGRIIYYAHPACLGMWSPNAGCQHGLTVLNKGVHQGTAPIFSITWQKGLLPETKLK